MMKIFAFAVCALLLTFGAVPMALAQQDTSTQTPSAAPSVNPPSSPAQDAAPKAPEVKAPDTKVDVDIKARTDSKSDDAGAASPRMGDGQRTSFFGLSPAAAIIVSAAVLLVVILAIVAMTNSGGSTTYIDKTDRRL
jgi:hypothetical protein